MNKEQEINNVTEEPIKKLKKKNRKNKSEVNEN